MTQRPIPPYYANPDDASCHQAVTKMILEHFEPNKKRSWDEINTFCGAEKGKGCWDFKSIVEFSRNNYDVTWFDRVDLNAFINDPVGYIHQTNGSDQADFCIDEGPDLEKVVLQVKELVENLTNIDWKNRSFTIETMQDYISQGYLLQVFVNPYLLYGGEYQPGGHVVLVYDMDERNVFFHDPGTTFQDGRTMDQNPRMKLSHADFMRATVDKPGNLPDAFKAIKPKKNGLSL